MTLSFGVSAVGAFAGDGMLSGEPVNAFELGFSLITAVMYLGPLFTAAWLAGWLMHMRRRRELGREDATLTAWCGARKTRSTASGSESPPVCRRRCSSRPHG
ncbi:hypothetical protein SHIRM173S_04203 [Streptomyces hirsutus]